MNVIKTQLDGLVVLEPKVHGDSRGFFFESYNQQVLAKVVGITDTFVQDNHSRSARNVLRGLHYQIRQTQGKLVRVTVGAVFDVAVDIRRSSATFGRWLGVELSAQNKRIVWVPQGFAHGFVVLSEYAEVLYKATDYWASEHERTIAWDDPDLAIAWPINGEPILSVKDKAGARFREAEVFE
jgi:dTDP-4-dehydrorhamnose 3,5-epimerase